MTRTTAEVVQGVLAQIRQRPLAEVLQALVYLHELIERGSADVDRTELGGQVLELGGFARLVHQHDTTRAIVLRAEFATPGGTRALRTRSHRLPVPRPR